MKKILKIITIVIISLVILITVFGVVDFNIFKEGKTPIFPLHVFTSFINATEDDNIIETDFKFHGVGYTITSCDKKSYNFHFGNINIQCFNIDEEWKMCK